VNYLKIIIGGRLTRDPETLTSKAGKGYVKFGIATNVGYGDSKKALFANVTMFGKRAEAVAQFFKKGDPILLECNSAEISEWTGRDGQKRTSLDLIGESFSFVGSASSGSDEEKPRKTRTEDIPF
jgi:single-strand DNA-binding protein